MSDAAQAFTLGEKAITELLRQLDAEKAMSDSLADALNRYWRWANRTTNVDQRDANAESDVFAVLARHREARSR